MNKVRHHGGVIGILISFALFAGLCALGAWKGTDSRKI
jgi:hypothetical protein